VCAPYCNSHDLVTLAMRLEQYKLPCFTFTVFLSSPVIVFFLGRNVLFSTTFLEDPSLCSLLEWATHRHVSPTVIRPHVSIACHKTNNFICPYKAGDSSTFECAEFKRVFQMFLSATSSSERNEIYWLTSSSKIFLQKLIITQLINKFPVYYYRNRRFITVFTRSYSIPRSCVTCRNKLFLFLRWGIWQVKGKR